MRLVLLIAFFLQATLPIPRTTLTPTVRTGFTHGVVVWIDNAGVRHKEQITQAQYLAIGNGAPPQPTAFVGTAQDWITLWRTPFRAWALGGRPSLNTITAEPVLGSAELEPLTSRVHIYTGDDLDTGLAPELVLLPGEYTGVFPNISTSTARCGLTVTNGQIQPGNLNVACSNTTRGR